MKSERSAEPVKPSEIEVGGRTYVLVPKKEFERMRSECESGREQASRYGSLSLGRDLREARRKKGVTLAQVACKAGIRLETLSRLESGRSNSRVATVRAVLQALSELN